MSEPEGRGAPAGVTSRATSFGAVADVYERGRPPYPAAAIEWLLPLGALRVLDVGAGTGKLTRQLSGMGLDVVAVEPSAGMREQFRQAVPGTPVLAGTAEHIPLADNTVDVVLMAQAWHWVDPDLALPEIARVLRPGGRLGVVWNTRDERVDWVARLSAIMHDRESDNPDDHTPALGPPFGPVDRHRVEWEWQLPADDLMDYVASRSYIITMTAQERSATLDMVRNLLATHPALAGAGSVGLPQVTVSSRADLPG
ncbi:MAG TPA: methyltransferase domain-containing protein [Streptosporangiaceae bacterium]|nr:methyltransferase domain-containing protein [Streptosporangiaceae bacterium]